jgi:translation initiation factor IF-1
MKLTHKENTEHIQWARDNYHTKVGISGPIKAIWHPAVRQEMHRIRLRQMDKIKLRVKEMTEAKAAIRYE